jgi:hypothetical protein
VGGRIRIDRIEKVVEFDYFTDVEGLLDVVCLTTAKERGVVICR